MGVEGVDDRRLFIDADDFAVSVSWAAAGGTVTLSAIHDAEYQLLETPYLDGGVEGATPQIMAVSADLPPTAAHDDQVTVKGRLHRVVEIKPDGTGMTVVRLQEV